jgi:hypothetical protein
VEFDTDDCHLHWGDNIPNRYVWVAEAGSQQFIGCDFQHCLRRGENQQIKTMVLFVQILQTILYRHRGSSHLQRQPSNSSHHPHYLTHNRFRPHTCHETSRHGATLTNRGLHHLPLLPSDLPCYHAPSKYIFCAHGDILAYFVWHQR